jgi:RNA polymerase sigma factor (sigma-70 family)
VKGEGTVEQPTFEANWPQLEAQLRGALTRRRVPFDEVEDVLQETALRLLRHWDQVRAESLWAYALTVALNIVRDEARKKERRDRSVLDKPAEVHDPEHEALVRLELDRVRVALHSMTERQRTILLGEVGEAASDPSTPAQKMARMRARRRLRSLTEDASALIALPFVNLRRWLHDWEPGLVTTGASLAMRLAALTTAAAIAIPITTGAVNADGIRPEESPSRRDHGSRAVARQTRERSLPSRTALVLKPAIGGEMKSIAKDVGEQLNEHFGVVHKDGDSVTLGGDEQIGPYGIEKSVEQGVGDSDMRARLKARYDAARCMNKFLQRPHSPCPKSGRLRGRLETVVDDEAHDVDVDTLTGPN